MRMHVLVCMCAGRPLEQWRQQFLIWASMRGQLLQRTVHGIM